MKIRNVLFFSALVFAFVSCSKENTDSVNQQKSTEVSALKAGNVTTNFTVHLTGDQEVPPKSTMAVGEAIFNLKNNGTELHYKLIVANIENVHMSHIHIAAPGTNGPVAVWLYPPGPPPVMIPGRFNGVLATGIITSANLVGPLAGMSLSDLMNNIINHNAYVNVHTEQNPGGEIRGQF
jgi:hypothetical protein